MSYESNLISISSSFLCPWAVWQSREYPFPARVIYPVCATAHKTEFNVVQLWDSPSPKSPAGPWSRTLGIL
jgi:hypothetical protein